MQVIAKFKVDSKLENSGGFEVALSPVVGGSAENDKFYKYTPAGSIKLTSINEFAAAEFIVGHEYYVTFTEAPEPSE